MISIQSSVHVFDEILATRRLSDILFCSCELYYLTPAVILEHVHINILYANMSRVSLHRSSCRYWPVCDFMTKFKIIHYSDPCGKFTQWKIALALLFGV